MAHDVAVAVCVKILDGQSLHAIEHTLSHIAKEALSDDSAQALIGKYAGERKNVNTHHYQDGLDYLRRHIGVDRRACLARLDSFKSRGDISRDGTNVNCGSRAHQSKDDNERDLKNKKSLEIGKKHF